MSSQMLVGEYLFTRIKELGVKSVYGVPGDYQLGLLDLLPTAGLDWKGSPNELNASYAADGYARINGVGALVTTFGPGELSALCGIAGAYCEYVPIVHIVGYPSVKAQRAKSILHHSLGHGTFGEFHDMSKKVCCATTVLMHPGTAVAEIDRCLNAMMEHSRPVYIGIPTDTANMSVPSAQLHTSLTIDLPRDDPQTEEDAVWEIRKRIEGSSRPVIIVDGLVARNRATHEAEALIKSTGLPYFVTAYGKGAVTEDNSKFGGVYSGMTSKRDIKEAVEGSDCVLFLGNYPSDFNSGEFTESIDPSNVIDVQRFWVQVGLDSRGKRFLVKMKHLLSLLNSSFSKKPLNTSSHSWRRGNQLTCTPYQNTTSQRPYGQLTHAYMWPRFCSFLQPNDVLVVETGTSQIGILEVRYPNPIQTYTQTIYSSIGFAAGSSVGAFVAASEGSSGNRVNRNILVTGDGSLQQTVQAFTDLHRFGCKPIVFLLNNGGYTVERMIHGTKETYNDVPRWNYSSLFQSLGPEYETRCYQIKSCGDFDKLISGGELRKTRCAQLVELFLNKDDAPAALKESGKMIEAFNCKL